MANFRIEYITDSSGRKIIMQRRVSRDVSRTSHMLPSSNDVDVIIETKKYGSIRLGDLYEKDASYLQWIVTNSRYNKTVKYCCARIIAGTPYTVPEDREEYDEDRVFDYTSFHTLCNQLGIEGNLTDK